MFSEIIKNVYHFKNPSKELKIPLLVRNPSCTTLRSIGGFDSLLTSSLHPAAKYNYTQKS